MFISSPISAAFALTGSVISLVVGIGLGVDPDYLYSGQWNESAVLSSIAIGSIFFVPNSWKHFIFTILCAVFSSIIQGAILQAVRPFGLPTQNIAYNITTWFWILAGQRFEGLHYVELSEVTVAEDHIRRFNLSKKLLSSVKRFGINFYSYLGIEQHKDKMEFEE
jgi:urea transporter